MAKHRSFKLDKFLKAVDPQLRGDYFSRKGESFPDDVNFGDDSFEDFWDEIEETKRLAIEEELHCINDTADKARDCLERAVRTFNIQCEEDESSETIAMRVFLHSEEAFSLAFDFWLYYHIFSEKLSHHKFQNVQPDFSDSRVNQFKAAVEQYFKDCGKSDNCDIRFRTDGDKQIILVARGDFRKTHLVFNNQKGKTDINSFRPAKEDMLVFNKRNNVLSLRIRSRGDEDKKKYIEMFGKAFFGLDEIDESTLNETLVVLAPIKNQTFNYNGNEQVEAVRLTEVNAKLRGGALRLVLKSNDLTNTIQGFGLSSDSTEYISAKLKFLIKREGKKSKQIAVEIKPPENSRVPEKKGKQIIEDYLREQGVLLE